jgi:hypothetical protein
MGCSTLGAQLFSAPGGNDAPVGAPRLDFEAWDGATLNVPREAPRTLLLYSLPCTDFRQRE